VSTNSRFAVAVHVLTLLAWAGDEPLKSDYVACSVNTNPVVIRRILCALARAGLVTSQTGAAGGSRLARGAGEITLRDVYRAVEPREIFSLHRQRPSQDCLVGMNIEGLLAGILTEVDGAVDRVLAEMTIEGLVGALKPCARRASKRRSGRARA
jgi:Rrf2 family protein